VDPARLTGRLPTPGAERTTPDEPTEEMNRLSAPDAAAQANPVWPGTVPDDPATTAPMRAGTHRAGGAGPSPAADPDVTAPVPAEVVASGDRHSVAGQHNEQPGPDVPASAGTDRDRPSGGHRQGALTAFAGVLAAALVLLGVGELVALAVSSSMGSPGPRPQAIAAQLVGALLAVPLYRWAGRRRGLARALAVLGLVAVLGLLLWWFWWTT
jgi:hypothetical protein